MIYSFIFVSSIVCANLLVAAFGAWFSVINSFLLIGLDLSLRDKLHDKWDGDPIKIGGLIAVSGFVSYLINPAAGIIAIASLSAFCLAMIADAVVYQSLKSKPWMIRANGSNIAGAGVDSIVFPTVAFGGFMPEIVAMQFASKTIGGFVWSWLLKKNEVS